MNCEWPTVFPDGVMRLITFLVHGGLALLAAPFLFGFHNGNHEARNFFMGRVILFLGSWMLPNWRTYMHTCSHPHNGMLPIST